MIRYPPSQLAVNPCWMIGSPVPGEPEQQQLLSSAELLLLPLDVFQSTTKCPDQYTHF